MLEIEIAIESGGQSEIECESGSEKEIVSQDGTEFLALARGAQTEIPGLTMNSWRNKNWLLLAHNCNWSVIDARVSSRKGA